MPLLSSVPAIAALLMAVMTSAILVSFCGVAATTERFATIDGLRGYLAFFVFLHHSCIWYFYLQTGIWDSPPIRLYAHMGESSIMLFFMITGFLFFGKILDGRKTPIDWGRLFVSRVLRLGPLYLLMLLMLFLIVGIVSEFRLHVSIHELATTAAQWLAFTIFDKPNLNGVSETNYIVAGVPWTLPYEWFFYFSLPLLGLLFRVTPPLRYLALSVLCIWYLIWKQPYPTLLFPFFTGALAARLVRIPRCRQLAAGRIGTITAIACFASVATHYRTALAYPPLILLSVGFIIVACGNTLFGIFLRPESRKLGEMAYSIYLLHGLLLFVTFHFALGLTAAKSLSVSQFAMILIGLTPVLILLSNATFSLIERPSMQSVTPCTEWLRSFYRE
jgi:peptidoglycan/LPS O-acetylase OafA/YrhL